MAEAMERWDIKLMQSLLPEVYAIIEKIDEREGHGAGHPARHGRSDLPQAGSR